jgi:small subunit ribosomal protein S24e
MTDAVVLKTRKVFDNKLLSRRQMSLEVHHGGKAGVSRKELCQKIAQMYKVKDAERVVVYGLKPQFGGGVTHGFAFVYDSIDALQRIEPGWRRARHGAEWKRSHEGTTRKQRKEKKNKRKITIGTAARAAKRAARKKD